MFTAEKYSTEELMGVKKLNLDLFTLTHNISKSDFKEVKRVKISTLHPNQLDVDGLTLNWKISGKGYTTPFVLITDYGNILIDGHHTVIAKSILGNRYIYCNTYNVKTN